MFLISKNHMKKIFRRPQFQPVPSRDVLLASYPRSGNTWLRSICFDLLLRRLPTSMSELDYGIPDIHYSVSARNVIKQEFFVVKTHHVFRPSIEKEYRCIYIVREPRDVLPSYRKYITHTRGSVIDKKEMFRDMLLGRQWPSSWFEHVTTWTKCGGVTENSGVIVRYEDLVRGDMDAWQAFLQVIGRSLEPAEVEELRSRHDIAQLRSLEKRGNRAGLDREEPWFVGKGHAEDEERFLVEECIDKYAQSTRELMLEIGYI